MEGQEYLNQISAANRPVKKSIGQFFSSKYFLFGMVAIVAFIAMAIFGAVMSGGDGDEKSLGTRLKLHLENTSGVIQTYQSNVKSSDLRSSSASLYSILSNTDRELTNYLTEKYGLKDNNIDKKIVEAAQLQKDGLEAELFEAKINGILDRIYAHKMAYEVSVILGEEAKLINTSKSDVLKTALSTSYQSLENLYDRFNNYSEAK